MNFSSYLDDIVNRASVLESQVRTLIETIHRVYLRGGTVFIIGNGGSAANASHLCEDLGKGTGGGLSVISLTDNVSYITAIANDLGYECVFSEQLKNLAQEGDLLIAISCSGNSPNILSAVDYAAGIGMYIIGITGKRGSDLHREADYAVTVPSEDAGLIEAVHGIIFHYIVDELREKWHGA